MAIVGAGVAGLGAARLLQDRGHSVVVFDKGRRPGGRLSTRHASGLTFDHGAQYFTATSEPFRHHVRSWIDSGVVREWTGRVGAIASGLTRPSTGQTTRYVGVPEMAAVAGYLARGLTIRSEVVVSAVTRAGNEWSLTAADGAGLGTFDVTLVTVPAPQAAPLLADCPALERAAAGVRLRPCWAVLVAFERPLDVPLDGAFVEHPALSWAARNCSKPGRSGKETWVLHASPAWSEAHLEWEPVAVIPLLLSAFAEALFEDLPTPAFAVAHRWRFAVPDPPLADSCLFDAEAGLGAGGDWCGGPKIEGAFRSGMALAEQVLARRTHAG